MVGLLITVLVAALVYWILAAITSDPRSSARSSDAILVLRGAASRAGGFGFGSRWGGR